jgi:ribosomal protein S18 acetylase RimI-like enzyme
MTNPTIFDPTKHIHLLPQFVVIHHACITQDFTLATFLPPLQREETLGWWKSRVHEVLTGTRTIIFTTQPSTEGSDAEGPVAGVVMLSKPPLETGPFRGTVEKLLVSPSVRRRGVATTLMMMLEEVTRVEGRPLLVSLFFCLD